MKMDSQKFIRLVFCANIGLFIGLIISHPSTARFLLPSPILKSNFPNYLSIALFLVAEILFLVVLRVDKKAKILGRWIRVLCWLCAVVAALFVLLRSGLFFLLLMRIHNPYWN